ncbi:hypothetical protein FACS189488_14080 [Betaproteobacteria bacterium]|nr:hypothetical protein FACS189488_14080 [Betaproteobacteria bacterium]
MTDTPPTHIRIGIIDSGAARRHASLIDAARAFVIRDDALLAVPAHADQLGHGSAVFDIVHHLAPHARFVIAQVFRERLSTTAIQVAAAIDWLAEVGVDLINLSLGLTQPRPVLEAACQRAREAGVVLCAAAPARGGPVFPAAFDGVWRMTGDARCARAEISCLMTEQADFGAHVAPLTPPRPHDDGPPHGSGASMGCAHLSGHLAALLASDAAPPRQTPARHIWLRERLQQQAHYFGPEHHT